MVNIVDTFTRLYKRPPTQEELAAMMRLKAEQETLGKLRQSAPVKKPKPVKKPIPNPDGITCNKRAWAINCLMRDGYSKKKIAFILCISEEQIDYTVDRFKLPRKDIIKPKEGEQTRRRETGQCSIIVKPDQH